MTNDRTRKLEIRYRMSWTGEVYSVAARNLTSHDKAAHAVTSGINKNISELPFWVRPFIDIAISNWDGDMEPLVEFGKALRHLNQTQGLYFCYYHYLVRFVVYWYYQNVQDYTIEELERSFKKNEKTIYYARQNDWLNELFTTDGSTGAQDILHKVSATLDKSLMTAKSVPQNSQDGLLLFPLILGVIPQYERQMFVEDLTREINSLPAVDIANTEDIVYSRYTPEPPVPRPDLEVGYRMKFKKDGLIWTVASNTTNFTILTGVVPAGRKEAGEQVYTIIDWTMNKRGAHDSYGHSTTTPESVQVLAEALEETLKPTGKDRSTFLPVSLGRNQVSLRIQYVKRPKK